MIDFEPLASRPWIEVTYVFRLDFGLLPGFSGTFVDRILLSYLYGYLSGRGRHE